MLSLSASATPSSKPSLRYAIDDEGALRIAPSPEARLAGLSATTHSQGLEIFFRLQGPGPKSVFARSVGKTTLWPARASAQAPSSLLIHRIDASGALEPVHANLAWPQQELASLALSASELFGGPHAPLTETDAALFLVLPPGDYLMAASPSPASTIRAIELRTLSEGVMCQ